MLNVFGDDEFFVRRDHADETAIAFCARNHRVSNRCDGIEIAQRLFQRIDSPQQLATTTELN